MYETAAHLVDRVLPFVAWRQWVLSYPRWLRLLLRASARGARLGGDLLSEVFGWQRRQARRPAYLDRRPARSASPNASGRA